MADNFVSTVSSKDWDKGLKGGLSFANLGPASDGSDKNKVVRVNSAGTGYELAEQEEAGGSTSVQSDLSVNDETDPAYVKNRTHWVENGETTITWDGETDGRTIVDPSGAGSNLWCKVADDTPVIGSFSTGTMEMASGSATEYSEEAVSANDNLYALCGGAIIVAYADGVSFSGLTLPQKGVYFTKNSGDYVSGWMFGETIYHPLPPELGGMPTLAEDGSDAGKVVRVNSAGTGFELVNLADIT